MSSDPIIKYVTYWQSIQLGFNTKRACLELANRDREFREDIKEFLRWYYLGTKNEIDGQLAKIKARHGKAIIEASHTDKLNKQTRNITVSYTKEVDDKSESPKNPVGEIIRKIKEVRSIVEISDIRFKAPLILALDTALAICNL